MDLRTFVENRKRRLIDDYTNVLRNKIHDLSMRIWKDDGVDAFADQHDGNVKPFCYSRVWGPLTFANASLTQFILPSYPSPSNIVVGREGAFYWEESNVSVLESWPMSAPNSVTIPANGFLFDSAFAAGGGAVTSLRSGVNSAGGQKPVGFDLVLYDKKRGRALHEDKLPREFFNGSRVTNKSLAEPIRFDSNSEIELRMFLNYPLVAENVTSTFESGQQIHSTRFFWINMMFKGHIALEG